MAELKTKKTTASVTAFINNLADEHQRKESRILLKMMKEVTGKKPRLWGSSIIGFGEHHYKYESGREGDWFLIGFSPRKGNLSIHLMCGLQRLNSHLKKLGKHKTGVGCLYVKQLADIDLETLRQMMKESYDFLATPTKK